MKVLFSSHIITHLRHIELLRVCIKPPIFSITLTLFSGMLLVLVVCCCWLLLFCCCWFFGGGNSLKDHYKFWEIENISHSLQIKKHPFLETLPAMFGHICMLSPKDPYFGVPVVPFNQHDQHTYILYRLSQKKVGTHQWIKIQCDILYK